MRFFVYLNLTIGLVFLFWSMLSYSAFTLSDFIFDQKGVDVAQILAERAPSLHISPETIYSDLVLFNGLGMLLWTIFLIALIFIWRLKAVGLWLFLGSFLAYVFLAIFELSWTYFLVEFSLIDKTLFALIVLSAIAFRILMGRAKETIREELESLNVQSEME